MQLIFTDSKKKGFTKLPSYTILLNIIHRVAFIFNSYFYAPRKISGEHIVVALSVRPSVRQSVRTTHSCPAHNFVIWSGISKLFYRNDHHVETTCRVQHLGSYLEGQGHSATLKQNRVRPITCSRIKKIL